MVPFEKWPFGADIASESVGSASSPNACLMLFIWSIVKKSTSPAIERFAPETASIARPPAAAPISPMVVSCSGCAANKSRPTEGGAACIGATTGAVVGCANKSLPITVHPNAAELALASCCGFA